MKKFVEPDFHKIELNLKEKIAYSGENVIQGFKTVQDVEYCDRNIVETGITPEGVNEQNFPLLYKCFAWTPNAVAAANNIDTARVMY